jgi:diguanylate cyclase (GGDEF)-like protein
MDELMPRIYELMATFYEKRQAHELAYKFSKEYLHASKIVEENRRKERIKSIEFQSKLSASIEETKVYRQLSNELNKSYQQLHVLSNIGQTMTSTHVLSDIFKQLYENVNLLMSAESVGVGLYDATMKALRFDLFIEKGKLLDSFSLSLENEKSYHVWSFLNKQTLVINDFEKDYKKYLKGSSSVLGDPMRSAMYAPLISEGEVIGVFSIQTKEKNAYTDTHKDLLQTLASYLAIAIKNAIKSRELAILNEKLKAMAEQDGLTGIPNRRLFDTTYDRLWNEALENQEQISILMIDIDNFKDFNDHYGHLTGDEVIIKVANLLYDERRNKNDFVARYGGDEFVMLLPNCALDQASEFAYKIKQSITSLNTKLNTKAQIAISIGVATTTPNAKKSKERFISISDVQLYICKANGKNQISTIDY